jgi:Ca-activated chloride channel homolog
VLAPTKANASGKPGIHEGIEHLHTGGGTNMGSGMELAYKSAHRFLSSDTVSRVIVLSDGDANIGNTNHQQILKSIAGYVSEGVTMSTVGFGTGNYQDHLMEQLANAGNGAGDRWWGS